MYIHKKAGSLFRLAIKSREQKKNLLWRRDRDNKLRHLFTQNWLRSLLSSFVVAGMVMRIKIYMCDAVYFITLALFVCAMFLCYSSLRLITFFVARSRIITWTLLRHFYDKSFLFLSFFFWSENGLYEVSEMKSWILALNFRSVCIFPLYFLRILSGKLTLGWHRLYLMYWFHSSLGRDWNREREIGTVSRFSIIVYSIEHVPFFSVKALAL